jgi:hypothetical protein
MAKVKKAQVGANLKARQYKRLGRIAEKNPNRAYKVAERMEDRATSVERGKGVAAGASARQSYKPSDVESKMVKKPKSSFRPAFAPKVKKAKSGASFPDLNKDGKITKADILKGRGVIKNGGKVKKAQAGLTASNKRVGPIDPKGAWTKVQEMNLPPRNVKTKVSLTRDKQLGATKMMKMGGKMKKK